MVIDDDVDDGRVLQLASIDATGLAVLDGGFATHLEDVLQNDISGSLWSAALLQSDAGCQAIVETHLAFLRAGAQVISTSTYQASMLSLTLAGISHDAAQTLIVRSVELGQQARSQHVAQQSLSSSDTPLLALSMGPYGAALSNGAEYTGDYYVPGQPEQTPPTLRDMIAFHYDRMAAVAAHSDVWQHVDVLAFETIPRLDEVTAIRKALAQLYRDVAPKHRPAAFVSLVFPNGTTLPYPAQAADATHMDAVVHAVLAPQPDQAPMHGVGINCTKPHFLAGLVPRLTAALQRAQTHRRPYLFLYPDGGLVWDGIARVWRSGAAAAGDGATSAWHEQVLQAARLAVPLDTSLKASWAGCYVGGCCKSTTHDITALQDAIHGAKPLQLE